MSERWKRWECPACRTGEGIDDPEGVYSTCCGKDHVCLLGSIQNSSDGYNVWAELDDHFYTKEQINDLMKGCIQ